MNTKSFLIVHLVIANLLMIVNIIISKVYDSNSYIATAIVSSYIVYSWLQFAISQNEWKLSIIEKHQKVRAYLIGELMMFLASIVFIIYNIICICNTNI